MRYSIMCLALAICLAGCATTRHGASRQLLVPYQPEGITVDGKLDEACYSEHIPLTVFSVAGEKNRTAPYTEAWVFWNKEQLICAFSCIDDSPAWMPPGGGEKAVDNQDRCELFLWNGDKKGPYFCIEAAPGGELHDYSAHFYRQFDDTWSPSLDWDWRATVTDLGYTIEMVLPKATLDEMGLELKGKQRFRIGLFRADYDKYGGTPTWVTWVDYGGKPDFHIAESFGTARLLKK